MSLQEDYTKMQKTQYALLAIATFFVVYHVVKITLGVYSWANPATVTLYGEPSGSDLLVDLQQQVAATVIAVGALVAFVLKNFFLVCVKAAWNLLKSLLTR